MSKYIGEDPHCFSPVVCGCRAFVDFWGAKLPESCAKINVQPQDNFCFVLRLDRFNLLWEQFFEVYGNAHGDVGPVCRVVLNGS